MKSAVKYLSKIYLYPMVLFAKHRDIDAAMNCVCECLENEDVYTMFRIKPKKSTTVPAISGMCTDSGKLAIVLQGPIEKTNMTEESVVYYRKMYPDATIIVSTWNDESEKLVNRLRNHGAVVLENVKPSISGILNVNYQIASSLAGIRKAKELGAEFVAKTRTDQRICKPYAFVAFINLLNTYSVEGGTSLKNRIIVMPTYYGNMFTPYFMSDFFYFGRTDDIELLFDIDQDFREPFTMPDCATRREYAYKMFPPEIYIMRHFLENKLAIKKDVSVNGYWDALKKYFIAVDRNMVDLYTTKYDYSHKDHVSFSEYFKDDTEEKKKTMNFGFINWLNLYSGSLNYKTEYEKEADVSML